MLKPRILQFIFCLILIFIYTTTTSGEVGPYKVLYFKQQVDHFSFTNEDTYLQRYLVNDEHWTPGSGPIFFYTGNEGDIEWFTNNTGFMWDIAPSFRALLVFAEHRYYGKSLPYGDLSYTTPKYLGYLTSEQALADFAELVIALKKRFPGAEDVPVIAFGGSYGGMLAAWIRMKYPHIIQGSLASSAPILQFTNYTDCHKYNQIVTNGFTRESPECSKSVRKSWDVLNSLSKTAEGRSFLSQTFRLCSPIIDSDGLKALKDWLGETYSSLAMMNYPYPTNFMSDLPGWPIKEVCKHLPDSSMKDRDLMKALFAGVSIYFNYTGKSDCLNTTVAGTADLGDEGWDYQACTEMVMPMCSDGINDMYEPSKWNFEEYSDECHGKYHVRPRELMVPLIYGCKNFSAASNIIFSNGDLDPWSGGGVLKSWSDSVVSIYVKDSAHHLDLRSANPQDPISVVKARDMEKSYIEKFIEDYKN